MMPEDTLPKPRRRDKIPPASVRPVASERPAAPHTADTPPAPADARDLGDGRVPGTAARAILEADAERLASCGGGTFLYGVLQDFFKSSFDKYSYVVFLQNLVAKMTPADPLEAMLVEQAVIAHHALGRLHVKAANADNADAAKVFFSAAARLQAEFRQSLLALKAYRGHGQPQAQAAETAAPPAPAVGSSGSEPPVGRPFGDTELGSMNRLSEFFHELAATRS